MRSVLATLRKKYFVTIAKRVPKQTIQFIILTHLLEDRPELLAAIECIGPISLLITIPYSVHQATLIKATENYQIATPSLQQLNDKHYLKKLVMETIHPHSPVIIIEIGGYFAPILETLQQSLRGKLVGVIEDTEMGHRAYENIAHRLPCPVVSVARSILKDSEDQLVGASCLYSTETLLRDCGFLIEGKRALVLGFGKVGRGMAHALLKRHCPVSVYDTDPIQRIKALSEGFHIPDRREALKDAELIYGATGVCSIQGEDFQWIKHGALLVSCSSKDVEFDLHYLRQHYRKRTILKGLDCFENTKQTLYLAAEGRPINFLDGAVIGPILALVQSEIILAIAQLIQLKGKTGLFETDTATKTVLAKEWLNHFCDCRSGYYKLEQTILPPIPQVFPFKPATRAIK